MHGQLIRLHGIDAPESGQTCETQSGPYRCGQRAAIALSDMTAGRTVQCLQSGKDRWGRIVARCAIDGLDLGDWMVEKGWAIAYRKYSLDYVEAEDRARSSGAGIWAGKFLPPEDWRKSR